MLTASRNSTGMDHATSLTKSTLCSVTSKSAYASNGPIFKDRKPWQSWSRLGIKIRGLHPSITTWDLWEAFAYEGRVVYIEIFENSTGRKDGNAKVRFEPPISRDFWSAGTYTVKSGNTSAVVSVELENNSRAFLVPSPARRGIWHPERIKLLPIALEFGFMLGPKIMTDMWKTSAKSYNQLHFEVDMVRKRIQIYFECTYEDPRGPKPAGTDASGDVGFHQRTWEYMFQIPFDQLGKIYEQNLSCDHHALIISMDSAPEFFRKQSCIKDSHSKDSLMWQGFDTWWRQTDAVYDTAKADKAVVALNKERSVIDLGTTNLLLM